MSMATRTDTQSPALGVGLAGRGLVQADGSSNEGRESLPSISSFSWKSIARRVLPSRLELNSPEWSFSEAPLKNVSFTTLLYVSPVQSGPW